MVRLAITGVGGRMGQALVRLAQAAPDLTLVAVTSRQPGRPVLLPARTQVFPTLEALLEAVAVDVVVDFTVVEAAALHARACACRGIPLVLGTTGLSAEAREAVQEAAGQAPIVFAPNFSVGITVLLQVAAQLSRVLQEGFDAEVLEVHHRMKRDAPSGTALRLAEVLAEARGLPRASLRLAREGLTGARPAEQIGVQALRGGDVVGEHTVFFLGEGERLELTHRATHRDTFAVGALRAARWVQGRPAGLYDMVDVLGMKEDA